MQPDERVMGTPHAQAGDGSRDRKYNAASGVDPAECARRAGQSIQVLFRYYAKFLAEARHHANRLIEDSMRRWDEYEDAPAGA
ncbi:hypothetical protein ACWCV5_03265 [Streptomyces tubercidicus]